MASVDSLFRLDGRVAVITGGAGLLGYQHAATIAGLGGIPVLLDINGEALAANAARLAEETGCQAPTRVADITDLQALEAVGQRLLAEHGRVDILINNAARNPKVESAGDKDFSRLEHFPWEQWQLDLNVGLGGAFHHPRDRQLCQGRRCCGTCGVPARQLRPGCSGELALYRR